MIPTKTVVGHGDDGDRRFDIVYLNIKFWNICIDSFQVKAEIFCTETTCNVLVTHAFIHQSFLYLTLLRENRIAWQYDEDTFDVGHVDIFIIDMRSFSKVASLDNLEGVGSPIPRSALFNKDEHCIEFFSFKDVIKLNVSNTTQQGTRNTQALLIFKNFRSVIEFDGNIYCFVDNYQDYSFDIFVLDRVNSAWQLLFNCNDKGEFIKTFIADNKFFVVTRVVAKDSRYGNEYDSVIQELDVINNCVLEPIFQRLSWDFDIVQLPRFYSVLNDR